MLFSSGWGLADVESNLHRLESSLQQQNRGFFIWRPFGYNTDPSLLSQTQFTCHRFERPWRHRRLRFERRWLDDVLFGRPVCCRDQVTKLFPVFLLRGNQDFLCGFSRNILDDRIGVVWPWLKLIPHPSSLATQLLLTRKPNHTTTFRSTLQTLSSDTTFVITSRS